MKRLVCTAVAAGSDGKPITESPLYDWQNPWANRDPRLDLFCLRPDTRLWGVQYDTDVRVEKVKDYNQSTAGKEVLISNADAVGNKSEYAANGSKGPGGYLWRKYSDKGMMGLVNGTKTEDDINAGIIRFAELLLIEAEANIEWDGGDLAIAEANINRAALRAQGRTVQRRVPLVRHPPLEDRFPGGQRPDVRSGVFDGAESGKLHLQRQAFVRRRLGGDLRSFRYVGRQDGQPARVPDDGLQSRKGLPLADPLHRAGDESGDRRRKPESRLLTAFHRCGVRFRALSRTGFYR